jgi:hypothetical protein
VLVDLGGVDVHADDNGAFRAACRNGHLETVKWLVGLGGVDVHADNDYPLGACRNGKLEVVRWLLSMDPTLSSLS